MRSVPRLIAISDVAARGAEATVHAFDRLCRAAPAGSVALQLRDNALHVQQRLELGRALRRSCDATGQWLLVNDRSDLALLCGADGVHLGESSVAARRVRALAPDGGWWLSRAWHDWTSPPDPDVDALVLSPVLTARKGREPLGLQRLPQAVAKAGRRALYALGGIGPDDLAKVIAAGAAGAAVQSSAYELTEQWARALGGVG